MSAEIIATLVMGAALAGLILPQLRNHRAETRAQVTEQRADSAGIRAEITQLCERMAYLDGFVSGLAPAIVSAARENQKPPTQ